MPIKVLVPSLGEGVEEVTVSKWLKHEGDSVEQFEPLLEVNTDKVDTEIPAPAAGVLAQVLIAEGSVAKVGEVLAIISSTDSLTDSRIRTDSSTDSLTDSRIGTDLSADSLTDSRIGTDLSADSLTDSRIGTDLSADSLTDSRIRTDLAADEVVHRPSSFISPVVARIAAENGVNLQQVKGTGLGGRITKEDVLEFVERGKVESKQVESRQVESADDAPDLMPDMMPISDRLIHHSAMRRQIAEHLARSKRTSPHVLTVMEADMSRVMAHHAANKDAFSRDGVNLTYSAYFIAAIATGLKACPAVNSSWSEAGVILHSAIHIGVATSLGEHGLIVPVIKKADTLSLPELARAVNDLAGRARAKKLKPGEVRGGTFTLTNHGVSGSLFAMPVINQPQCGILGSGAIQKRVVVVKDARGGDAIAIRPMVYLSFVFDHRILDGVAADGFLSKVKETLENWA